MHFVLSLIAAAAIASAVSLQVVAGEDEAVICQKLDQAISKHGDVQADGEKAFVLAKDWLARHLSLSSSKKSNLINAWENISKSEGCSPSSWQNLLYMGNCKPTSSVSVLYNRVNAYAKDCLTPDYVSKIVKSKTNNLFDDVNFVDAKFIQKFYLDNPDDWPIHVNWVGNRFWDCLKRVHIEPGKLNAISCHDQDLNCCRPKRSKGAVIDAIERDFANQGKDLATELQTSAAVSEYLERKLFNPCKRAVSAFQDLAREIALVTKFYEGGQRALIASLDQETKDFLFRQKYCDQLSFEQGLVLEQVEKYVQSKSQ